MARKKQVVEQVETVVTPSEEIKEARLAGQEEVAEVKRTTKEVIAAIRASRKTKKGRKAVAELGMAPDLVVEAPEAPDSVVEAPAEEIVNVAPGSETPDVLLDEPVNVGGVTSRGVPKP